MKIIILIQSIIILVGAYYIYTLPQAKTVVESAPTVQIVPVDTVREGYVPPTTQPPRDESVTTETSASSNISGPSDVGMEYPIMDEGIQVQ